MKNGDGKHRTYITLNIFGCKGEERKEQALASLKVEFDPEKWEMERR